MKVIYNTIEDDILDANRKAVAEGRTIKEIILTHDEFHKLRVRTDYGYPGSYALTELEFAGLTIKKEK